MSSSQDSQGRESQDTHQPEQYDNTAAQVQSAHQATVTEKSKGKRRSRGKQDQSGSETETGAANMSSHSSKMPSASGSSRKHGSSSKHRSSKDEDWSEVTDPEERRRIQNRIAQRKFRGKAKEQREKNERDQRNQEHAGDSYRVPEAGAMTAEEEQAALSGLPWGGVNMQYAMGSRSSGGSQRSRQASDPVYADTTQYLSPYTTSYQYTGSWDGQDGGSPDDDQTYYDGGTTSFYYDYDTKPSY